MNSFNKYLCISILLLWILSCSKSTEPEDVEKSTIRVTGDLTENFDAIAYFGISTYTSDTEEKKYFSLMIMPRNPINPGFEMGEEFWNRYVLESLSWIGLDRVARDTDTFFFLNGYYPDGIDELVTGVQGVEPRDPWARQYRLVTRGGRLLVTGSDAEGQPIPFLILSRHIAWEEGAQEAGRQTGPGVRLLQR